MPKCNENVNSKELSCIMYYASRVLYIQKRLYNGRSNNCKADWTRFIRRSNVEVVGLNLTKVKVDPRQVSKNTVNSLVNTLNTCQAVQMRKPTLIGQMEGVSIFKFKEAKSFQKIST